MLKYWQQCRNSQNLRHKTDIKLMLTAIGLTPGSSSTVHIYTQTIHITKQSTQNNT
jgi:hypothetical protein